MEWGNRHCPLASTTTQQGMVFKMHLPFDLMETEALIHAWTLHWHFVYQFDYGLQACSTIAVTDDPIDQGNNPLASQPLWMPKMGNNVVLLPWRMVLPSLWQEKVLPW